MKEVRLGLVGCGGFGNYHLNHLLRMEGVRVAALYSRNPFHLAKTGERVPGAVQYGNFSRMLEKERLDGLLISLTPDGHGDFELQAARAGVPFYVEKPLGLSLEAVSQVAGEVEARGLLTSVGYQDRYSPVYGEIRKAIAGKKVGLVSGSWIDSMPGAPWWRRQSQSGGQMVEQCTHIVDALRYLFGEVSSVFAWGNREIVASVPDCDVDGCVSSLFRFESGVLGSVSSGCYLEWRKGAREVGLTIHAEDVKIHYDWGRRLRLETAEETREIRYTQDWHVTAVEAFVQALRDGDASGIRSDYADGVKSLAVSLAVNRSLASGMPEPVFPGR